MKCSTSTSTRESP